MTVITTTPPHQICDRAARHWPRGANPVLVPILGKPGRSFSGVVPGKTDKALGNHIRVQTLRVGRNWCVLIRLIGFLGIVFSSASAK